MNHRPRQSLAVFRGEYAGKAILLAAIAFAAITVVRSVHACPFCNAAMQTLSEEITSSDMAVIAQLEGSPAAKPADLEPGAPGAPMSTVKFRVLETLQGGDKLGDANEIDVVYFGDDVPDKKFLITALKIGDKSEWTTPIPLSERAVEYVRKLKTVPTTGPDRIAFFQEYLEDEDPLLAQDAYDEFSRAPYPDVIALGPRMHRDKLLKWIDDPRVGPTGRRLYVTMLGVCALPEDVDLLESMLTYDYQILKPAIAAGLSARMIGGPLNGASLVDEVIHTEERRKKESLDALIACYLKLKGPAGLELINQLFLANPNVEYKYLHAAIMALRFHGEQTDVLPREELLKSVRLALDHKDFADQVIPDLTRWDDWEVMPRLVKMFKDAPSDDWIRQPVASYLLVAAEQPGEVGSRAKQALDELETLDPDAITRARNLSAFSLMPRTGSVPTTDGSSQPPASKAANDPTTRATDAEPSESIAKKDSVATDEVALANSHPESNKPQPALPTAATPAPPSKLKIIGVPLIALVLLVAIFAVLLRGADPRSSEENP